MSNELTLIEQNLDAITPQLEDVVRGLMPVARLKRTILISIERTPKILQCSKQSIIQSTITAGVLCLEVDGVTGQGYLIPFGQKCQFAPGYKGYNTLGARSRYSITGDVVCENDAEWEYLQGTEPRVIHRPAASNRGRVIAAWAVASHKDMPSIPSVLNLEELMAVKAKSPGARKSDSPWNDPSVGFPAMCSKTAKRRLARSMPLNIYQWGAAMDEAFEERGLTGRVTPDGPVIDQPSPIASNHQGPADAPQLTAEPVEYRVALADGSERKFMNPTGWLAFMQLGFSKCGDGGRLSGFWKRNLDNWQAVNEAAPDLAQQAHDAMVARKETLSPDGDSQYG